MTKEIHTPVLLVAGHWLGAWAWDDVLSHLRAAGIRPTALTLPGLDDADPDRLQRTLEDQTRAIADALTHLDAPAVIVAHSGANAPVTLVLDRYPELVQRVIWVDSGPIGDGSVFAPDLPLTQRELPLPPFERLAQQASLAGLTPGILDEFRARALSEPAGVLTAPASLRNPARHGVPTTMVCCSISSAQVRGLLSAGHPMFAAVGEVTDAEWVDLPTGHWPMWSRPRELAEIITAASLRRNG
ncbi:pimeloyl-ACP methyl ester carboxylesterase [Microbacterium sp. SORGH_AS428]|uniref:alpha/beta fold hydrolase n=1 Tax=Microbacterium sp. SORGH_AS_0428 TaxID=3041788 RepID=UPI00285A36B7|nr:alpha/beta hydrolase family protein [Microbacterium sp. SORGH_AS_0428]MDR6198763.1 pimeloyl-ACP methyl ester carboxylesterase [Microbacterium sp. SORGH_AS_0428]